LVCGLRYRRSDTRCAATPTPGEPRLSVSAPKNLFELQFSRPENLLVAGGIGITPIVGMAQVLARRGEKFRPYALRVPGGAPRLLPQGLP
jgi:hypothetical protein